MNTLYAFFYLLLAEGSKYEDSWRHGDNFVSYEAIDDPTAYMWKGIKQLIIVSAILFLVLRLMWNAAKSWNLW